MIKYLLGHKVAISKADIFFGETSAIAIGCIAYSLKILPPMQTKKNFSVQCGVWCVKQRIVCGIFFLLCYGASTLFTRQSYIMMFSYYISAPGLLIKVY